MRPGRRRYRAGESALQVWRTRRRQTIRREWRVWTVLPLAVIALGVGLIFTRGVGQLLLAAALGSLLTALYVGWQLGADVRSLTWVWGHVGEQQTEAVLKPLER